MTVTIDLTQEEEAQLHVVASIRGVEPEEHAHTLLANILRDVPVPEQGSQSEERERLITAIKPGDQEVWLKLLYLEPPISQTNAITGETFAPIPDEALRRENIYEDRL